MNKRKPKFRVGQVVAIGEYYRAQYGRVVEPDSLTPQDEAQATVRQWDADNGDFWEGNYPTDELRLLTAREVGPGWKRKKGE